MPRTDNQPNHRAEIRAPSDGEVFGQEGSKVRAGGDTVSSDVGAELGEGEGGRDDEYSNTLCGGRVIQQELREEIQGVPDGCAVDDFGRGRNDDPNEGCECEADGDREELWEEGVTRVFCETGEIGVVDDEGGEVGEGGHESRDEAPEELAATGFGGLTDDGADATGAGDGPDEECEAGEGDEDGFEGEEVADRVDGKPLMSSDNICG